MIVSRAKGFAFLHVPKCGGSTIREQVSDLHDIGGKFRGRVHHETLGLLNGGHLPLWVLEEYFPEAFAAVTDLDSYMLCREPMDRFVSAVSQMLRRQYERQPEELDATQTRRITDDIIAELREVGEPVLHRHAIFIPQVRYRDLRGQRLVDEVIPLERIDVLFDMLEHRHDVTLMRDTVWNPTVTYRFPRLTPALTAGKDVLQRHLPVAHYAKLRDLAASILTRKGAPRFQETLKNHQPAIDFVQEMYGEDFKLYRDALTEHGDGAATAAPQDADN